MQRTTRLLALLSALACLLPAALAQEAPPTAEDPAAPAGPPPGLQPGSREAMWWAPTEADWALPCRITWQRTWGDALAVARETGKPLLICVNMDGEIASEHYAGVRYRQPQTAALYEPYVCVIASVYRHTPRDHDEDGQRIPCPRFGSVTCGEHIAIEPLLYDQYFEGTRVAPRHIMVELDQKEVYDVYYAFDTDTIFEALKTGVEDRPLPEPPPRGDRSLYERVASRDIEDRAAVEQAYVSADRVVRKKLLQEVAKHKDIDHTDMLRLALFGNDEELSEIAWQLLSQSTSASAVDLINEALRFGMTGEQREVLVSTLERIGETVPKARRLAVVHRALMATSETLDVESLSRTGDEMPLMERLELVENHAAEFAQDNAVQIARAEVLLAAAYDSFANPEYADLLMADARMAVEKLLESGVTGWRMDGMQALFAMESGRFRDARQAIDRALGAMPADAETPLLVPLLELFVSARQRAIANAANRGEEFPAQWLTDMDAAFRVLLNRGALPDQRVVQHYDFLKALGALGRAYELLDAGLDLYPTSWDLHDRLRGRLLAEKKLDGLQGLEAIYDEMVRAEEAHPDVEWFAGYASLVAAEFHRRAGNRAKASSSYDRAIDYYQRSAEKNPDNAESSNHYVAMALSGKARVAFEEKQDEAAVRLLLESFERDPNAAGALDGLNLSGVATARSLIARLSQGGLADQAAKLSAALDALPPEQLAPAAFEGQGGPSSDARRIRRERGGGR